MNTEFPIRCYTCNRPLSGKWLAYKELVKDAKLEYLTPTTEMSVQGLAMNVLELKHECCRRHFLTHPGK